MPEEIHYTSADGLSLFAKAYGDPDAALSVICMHGLTRNHKDFEPMIAGLSPQHRYIAVDVRGRGRSARSEDPNTYQPAIYAEDMRALLDHLAIPQAVLIGTSMGGLMAMIMMHTMPERVSGVVLNDVGPELNPEGLARIAGYVGAVEPVRDWGSAATAVANAQAEAFPSFSRSDWLAFAKRTYRETEDGRVILDYDPAIAATVSTVKPGFRTRFAMWRLFGKLKARPFLLIRGERSDILQAKTAARMVKRHKSAQLVTVPGVGHAPLLDERSALVAIDGFLANLATPGTGPASETEPGQVTFT